MRKIYLSLISLLVMGGMAFGQADPENAANYVIKKTAGTIAIDGVEDDTWAEANEVTEWKNFRTEAPTLGQSYWKALWNDTAIFVLIYVNDDDFWPADIAGGNDYEHDKCEIYINVNELPDTAGPAQADKGAWQIAPPYEAENEGVPTFHDGWNQHSPDVWRSHLLDGESYIAEYSVRLDSLYDKNLVALTTETAKDRLIGWDITIIDTDEGTLTARSRQVWQSDGNDGSDEAWNTMKGCGTATLEYVSGLFENTVSVSSYPNPVVDVVTINAEFNKAVVSNVLGQDVMTFSQVSSKKLNVSELPKGIYIVNLYKDAKLTGVTKIIKK